MQASDAEQDVPGLDPRVERCRRVLDTMTEVGMALLDAMDLEGPIGETALAFSRISRAIRLAVLLDLKLESIARDVEGALAVERGLGTDVPEADAEDSADNELAKDEDRAEPVEFGRVRLDREAPDEALRYLKRPMTEMVAAICRGLELSPETTAEHQAPFAALVANDDGDDDPPNWTAKFSTAGVPPASSPPDPGRPAHARTARARTARALGP